MASERNEGGYLEESNLSSETHQLAQIISSNIQKIAQNSAEIQKILSYFGKPQDNIDLRHKLQQKQQLVNHLAKETERSIKDFGSLKSINDQQRHKKLMKDRLVADFTTALTSFQRIQREVAEKEKEFVARVRAGSRLSASENQSDGNLLSIESSEQFEDQLEDGISVDDLELIKDRESAIKQLESDILDINEIFKDLGMMIHEQGDLVDSIEANVETAEVHVQQANQQLSRASDYQRKSRKKMFILIVVLVVLAVVVGVIIWASVRK
ncbi:syntaxin-7-like [Scyliorhinus canicula]|uniref:syntaxin-7-like n=1 Tax=Scyliorhinus canicula TaxID=7830 RepID=UPI0018F3ED3F|nr:syntaxin-7-like [Scyliorhinus canicula]XP_038655805.1 syntaxin-7-like [Scyliorhinus canicula]XP_038655806.1 syntaxin-7-like [Scyliorhinus canicula]XP_038655807.1 syntaxin-7-like [Scyliorhinus canicula]